MPLYTWLYFIASSIQKSMVTIWGYIYYAKRLAVLLVPLWLQIRLGCCKRYYRTRSMCIFKLSNIYTCWEQDILFFHCQNETERATRACAVEEQKWSNVERRYYNMSCYFEGVPCISGKIAYLGFTFLIHDQNDQNDQYILISRKELTGNSFWAKLIRIHKSSWKLDFQLFGAKACNSLCSLKACFRHSYRIFRPDLSDICVVGLNKFP
jgi:hypothetical protein